MSQVNLTLSRDQVRSSKSPGFQLTRDLDDDVMALPAAGDQLCHRLQPAERNPEEEALLGESQGSQARWDIDGFVLGHLRSEVAGTRK